MSEDQWYPSRRVGPAVPGLWPAGQITVSDRPGQIQVIPPSLTEADVRRVVREELERARKRAS